MAAGKPRGGRKRPFRGRPRRGDAGGRPRPGGRGAKGRRPDRRRVEPRPPRRPRPVATVLVATHNRGKLREILDRLRDLPVYFQLLDEMPVAVSAPVEDASSFSGNARKKALHYTRHTDHVVLAEDSGLMVDALDGAPGVRSARFAGAGATDADRIRLLLSKMDGVRWEYRTARFVCAAALARAGEILASFEGVAEGRIALEPTGSGGFGYDPIFHHDASGRTFAEMTREDKFKVSHRGRALEQVERWLRDHLALGGRARASGTRSSGDRSSGARPSGARRPAGRPRRAAP